MRDKCTLLVGFEILISLCSGGDLGPLLLCWLDKRLNVSAYMSERKCVLLVGYIYIYISWSVYVVFLITYMKLSAAISLMFVPAVGLNYSQLIEE